MLTKLPAYLSPETIGELPESEREIQVLFIYHWRRMIGPWYTISSEDKPQPVRLVSESEVADKNTQFWRTLVNELLQHSDNKYSADFVKEISIFLNADIIHMPYLLGKKILQGMKIL